MWVSGWSGLALQDSRSVSKDNSHARHVNDKRMVERGGGREEVDDSRKTIEIDWDCCWKREEGWSGGSCSSGYGKEVDVEGGRRVERE